MLIRKKLRVNINMTTFLYSLTPLVHTERQFAMT
ncbi:hypothetical protein Xkoz_01900 [Xenorhabdus kozodoii]|uniref:Uncharacterized protein n=1 Tax=Xenorhabdus kozodoii TaxID=351676 RepID=A0A2D0LCQ1_9GAMM|nr:hypothetical protein Xkoz_01900 [Xenorhabdus kozodoii]